MLTITDRAGVEELRTKATTVLAAAGYFNSDIFAANAGQWNDADMAAIFFGAATRVTIIGRGVNLHPACQWLGESFSELAEGNDQAAFRWANLAAAELEDYAGAAGPHWAAEAEQLGGAS